MAEAQRDPVEGEEREKGVEVDPPASPLTAESPEEETEEERKVREERESRAEAAKRALQKVLDDIAKEERKARAEAEEKRIAKQKERERERAEKDAQIEKGKKTAAEGGAAASITPSDISLVEERIRRYVTGLVDGLRKEVVEGTKKSDRRRRREMRQTAEDVFERAVPQICLGIKVPEAVPQVEVSMTEGWRGEPLPGEEEEDGADEEGGEGGPGVQEKAPSPAGATQTGATQTATETQTPAEVPAESQLPPAPSPAGKKRGREAVAPNPGSPASPTSRAKRRAMKTPSSGERAAASAGATAPPASPLSPALLRSRSAGGTPRTPTATGGAQVEEPETPGESRRRRAISEAAWRNWPKRNHPPHSLVDDMVQYSDLHEEEGEGR